MSITPDYFISSCGYPKLNREKYKIPLRTTSESALKQKIEKYHRNELRKRISTNENRTLTQTSNVEQTRQNQIATSDKKKLLKKRVQCGTSSVISNNEAINNQNRPTKCGAWNSDKERKCFENQNIKNVTTRSKQYPHSDNRLSNSNYQLDNRLSYSNRRVNGVFRFDQTDSHNLVLPPLQI